MRHFVLTNSSRRPRRVVSHRIRAAVAGISTLVLGVTVLPLGLVTSAEAVTAPVGQGFNVTKSDLAFILKQIQISERHVRTTTAVTGPCSSLLGDGPSQVPNPLLSYGLRTVDGSCNNLQPDRADFGASHQPFPRHAPADFRPAEAAGPFGPPGQLTTYDSKNTNVVDSQPRLISNLIVDQTATNPAAIAAALHPVRTQGNPGVEPCVAPGDPVDCIPTGQTLFIPNVTTDVGLSPPYNSWFTLFGQFFDHGLDFTKKSHGAVFVPLRDDDPLLDGIDGIPGTGDEPGPNTRFMALTRTENLPGEDGVLGTADDVKDGVNTDTPFVDQSQTYTSVPSHQVFLREYTDVASRPRDTGKLLSTADGGMPTWAFLKANAADVLGIRLTDADIFDIPMLVTDPYGNFTRGPARGLPMLVTKGPDGKGLTADDVFVEGNRAAGGLNVPADVVRVGAAFLDDIAHNAVPSPGLTPDSDTAITGLNGLQETGTYDNEMLDAHFMAGDGRTNENIGLTAVHQVFHSEHDRLVADIKNTLETDLSTKGISELAKWQAAPVAVPGPANTPATAPVFDYGQRLFQAARFVTEMEYQHLVFEEFGRKIQPLINPFTVYHDNVNPAIRAEFAHAVYRFGHSMLTDTISRTNEDGSNNDISLFDGFLNPPAFNDAGPGKPRLSTDEAVGAIVMGMSDQVGNELDEFVTNTLRNNLLGLPLDLATINMARARDAGVPTLNNLRRSIHNDTQDSALQPYESWLDFGLNLKHPESLVNFVAAYGLHPSITGVDSIAGKRAAAQLLVDPPIGTDPAEIPTDAAAFITSSGAWENTTADVSTTGVDGIDLWVGGLAERTNLFGGLLGSTFNFVFEQQMTDLQNGDRFYYLARTPGMNLRAALEGNSFAEMIMRNSNAHTLKADAFGTADCKFQLANLAGTAAGFQAFGTNVADDPTSECDEHALLVRKPDGTLQYRTTNTVDPAGINGQAVYNGTAGEDRVYGGVDNDTFLGNEGNDRIEGGDGADVALGGEGNDIITDLAGDDVLKGGPGADAIDAGPGLDIVMAGEGNDFTNGGANDNETFGGDGDDMIIAGAGNDTVFGDGGSDWIEGGDGQELLCGDSCAPFFDDPNSPGDDVLIGQNGEEDYDAEGGNDILSAGPGIERNAGAAGFDWSMYQYDPLKANADLNLSLIGVPLPAVVFRDRYQEVEALSGSKLDDILRGDDVVPSTNGGAGFSGCNVLDAAGIARIRGLDQVVPAALLTTAKADVVAAGTVNGACDEITGNVWGAGNIILGGGGSDLMEGRGADDILDGDRYLNVRLSVLNDLGVEIGTTDLMEKPYQVGNPRTLQQDVFAGRVSPDHILIVREILSDSSGVDTAVFSGVSTAYTITRGTGVNAGVITVDSNGGVDGIDRLTNVERLQFTDRTIVVGRPGTPTLGAVVPGSASVLVNWTAPANSVGGVTGYDVRVVRAAAPATTVAVLPAGANATSLNVTGLTNGTAYQFQVRAKNNAIPPEQLGDYTALSAPVTPLASLARPNAPTITGTQGPVGAPLTVGATWVNQGNGFTYRFTATPVAGGAPITAIVPTTVQLFVFRTGQLPVPAGGAYLVKVNTISAAGVESLDSNTVTVTAR